MIASGFSHNTGTNPGSARSRRDIYPPVQLQLASGASDAAVASTEHGVERLERTSRRTSQCGAIEAPFCRPVSLSAIFPGSRCDRTVGSPPRAGGPNRAVAIWEQLASEHPEVPGFEHDRAGTYFYLDLSYLRGRRPGWLAAGDPTGDRDSDHPARRNPENRGYQRELSQFYSVSGDAYVILGKDLAEGLKRQECRGDRSLEPGPVGKDGLEPGNVPRSQTARSCAARSNSRKRQSQSSPETRYTGVSWAWPNTVRGIGRPRSIPWKNR